MIKAIFVDFDWTLFDHKTHTIIPSAIEGFKKAQQNGVKIIINSARSYFSLEGLDTFKTFDFDGFVTVNGGACFLKNEDLYVHSLPEKLVKKITKELEKRKINYVYICKYTKYVKVFDKDVNDEFHKYFYEPVPTDMSEYKGEPVMNLQIFETEKIDKYLSKFKNIHLNRFYEKSIEVEPKPFRKDEGIKAIIKHFNYKEDELMAFGDDYNDIDMFKLVKYGICMGNGREEVKPYAYYVTSKIEDDGIYNALKHFNVI